MLPIHPGGFLLEDFLEPLGLSQNQVALAIGVSPRRINEICLGKRRITGETALRLSAYFGVSAELWLGLQMDYDLDIANDRFGDRIKREVRPHPKNPNGVLVPIDIDALRGSHRA
jgi:addiction module HigA family antidote